MMAKNDESKRFSAIFRQFEEQPKTDETTTDRVRPVNRLRMKYSNSSNTAAEAATTTPDPTDYDHDDPPPLPPHAPSPPAFCSSSQTDGEGETTTSGGPTTTGPPLPPKERNGSRSKDGDGDGDSSGLSDTVATERRVEEKGNSRNSDPDHGAQQLGRGSEDRRRKSSGSDCEGFSEETPSAVGSQGDMESETGHELAGTSPTNTATVFSNDDDVCDQTKDYDASLSSYVWFFDEVDREKSEQLLTPMIKLSGSYLVRKSERGGDASQHSLSVVYRERIYHLRIRQREDGNFAIGKAKDDEKKFETIPLLINFYQNNFVELIGDSKKKIASGKVQLKHCPPK